MAICLDVHVQTLGLNASDVQYGWAKPLRAIAARLGVSGSGLAKACRQHAIPTPDRGYWAKLKAGKSTIKARLPLREPGMSDHLRVGGHRHY